MIFAKIKKCIKKSYPTFRFNKPLSSARNTLIERVSLINPVNTNVSLFKTLVIRTYLLKQNYDSLLRHACLYKHEKYQKNNSNAIIWRLIRTHLILLKGFLVLRIQKNSPIFKSYYFYDDNMCNMYHTVIKNIKKCIQYEQIINSENEKNASLQNHTPLIQYDPNDLTSVYAPYGHLWTMCENCVSSIYRQYAKENNYICEYCSFHLQMDSSDRIESLIDSGTWDPVDDNMLSIDPYENLRSNKEELERFSDNEDFEEHFKENFEASPEKLEGFSDNEDFEEHFKENFEASPEKLEGFSDGEKFKEEEELEDLVNSFPEGRPVCLILDILDRKEFTIEQISEKISPFVNSLSEGEPFFLFLNIPEGKVPEGKEFPREQIVNKIFPFVNSLPEGKPFFLLLYIEDDQELTVEKTSLEELTVEKIALEKLAAEKIALEKLAAEKIALEKLAAEKTSPEESTAEQTSPEESTAEELILEEPIANKYTIKELLQLFLLEEKEANAITEERKKNLLSANNEDDPDEYVFSQEYVNSYQKKTGLTDAIQTGIGQLNGIPVGLAVMDFEFIGGSMGSVVGEKITRLIEYATNKSLPVIISCASGGARMQEGSFSLMQMGKISSVLLDYQLTNNLFLVSLLTTPTTGGVTASFGMLGNIIIGEPDACIAFAGQRVIENIMKIEVPEGLQETENLFEKGAMDLIVPRNLLKGVLSELLKFHGFFPLNKNENKI